MAGRNVGDIEITVNANTGRLEASVFKGASDAGRGARKIIDDNLNEIGGAGLARRMKVVRAKIEAGIQNIEANIGVDAQNIQKEIKQLEAQLQAAANEIAISPDFDNDELANDLRFLQSYLVANGLVVGVEGEVDAADILDLRREIQRLLKGIEAEIGVNLDDAELFAERQKLQALADKEGAGLGDIFGNAFSSRLGKIVAGVALVFEPLTIAAEGLATGVIAVLGSASLGLIGGVGALTGVFAGFVGILAGSITGARGFGDALGAINEELETSIKEGGKFDARSGDILSALQGLTPNAQDTALAFADVRQSLADAQDEIQEKLFEGLGDEIRVLGEDVVPDLTEALGIGAEKANDFARNLSKIAQDTDFTGLFRELEPAMDSLVSGASAFVGTIEPFLRASAPVAAALARSFERSALAFKDFVEDGEETGSLTEFLSDGLESLQGIAQLAGSLGSALATLFSAGQESGDGFIQKLDSIVTRWDNWMKSIEGQKALNTFFKGGEEAIGFLSPVLDGLREAFEILISDDARANFEGFATAVGELLPFLAELLSVLGDAGILTTILNLLVPVGELVALIGKLPAPVIEVTAAVGLGVIAMVKLAGATDKALAAFEKLTATAKLNPKLVAIGAAIGVAVVAWRAFTGGTDEAAERTKELIPTLDGAVEALLRESDAADRATLGIEALDLALSGSDEAGREFTKNLGAVGLTADETTKAIVALRGEPVDTLTELAGNVSILGEELGLTGEQSRFLAEQVDNTSLEGLILNSEALASILDITKEEVQGAAITLKELQNAADNTDLRALITDQFELALGADDASRALAEEALAGVDLATSAEKDLVVAFAKLVASQAQAEQAAIDTQKAQENLSTALEIDPITEARIAWVKWEESVLEAGTAAFQAEKDQARLETRTRRVATEIAVAAGVSPTLVTGFANIGIAAGEAAAASGALDNILSTLFGRAISEGQALDDISLSLQTLAIDVREATETTDGAALSLGGFSAESIELRTNIREAVVGIGEYATSALEAGTANSEVISTVEGLRTQLIEQVTQLGITDEAAAGYISTLLGTPELLSTIIKTPGILDALLNAEDLTLLYDEAGEPVISEFEQIGIDDSLADSEELKELIQELDGLVAKPRVEADTAPVSTAAVEETERAVGRVSRQKASPEITVPSALLATETIDGIETNLGELDEFEAAPGIELPTYEDVQVNVDDLISDLETLDLKSPSITISLPGISARTQEVRNLNSAIEGLRSRSLTITTNNVSRFSSSRGGNTARMAGGLIKSPETADLGEFGLREAVIPLQLPLSRVNAEVRDMAAMVRGEGQYAGGGVPQTKSGPTRVVNNTFTINETDRSETTAHRVANRIASSLL